MMFCPRNLSLFNCLLSTALAASAFAAPPLVGDQPLKIGGDGVGLLATQEAYKTIPYGAANIFGGRRPDVFAGGTRGVVPSLNLYRYVRDNAAGQPVFAEPIRVKHPLGERDPADAQIVTAPDGQVYGFWFSDGKLIRYQFDKSAKQFIDRKDIALTGLKATRDVTVAEWTNDELVLVVSTGNGAKTKPEGDQSSNDYNLYDATGKFKGEWPYVGLFTMKVAADLSRITAPPAQLSRSKEEIRSGGAATTVVKYPSPGIEGVVAGSSLGNLYFFPMQPGSAKAGDKRALFTTAGVSIRHPTVGATPISYPNADGSKCDLIVGGEGSLYYYRFTGKLNEAGHPVYEDAAPVWQENAEIFAGTLPVPNVVDWDGDEKLDLIVGNSEGKILFYKNNGSNAAPDFANGIELKANGETIQVQPGYYGIQGPFETRWGYLSPNVADWNGDGLPDILISGATARHEVMLNVGTKTAPKLAAAKSIFFDGLELHGVWRVRPGVAKVDGRMAYVMQDDDNALRLFWRIDDQNVADGGQLKVTDGRIITSHITGKGTGAGQTGRSKIEIVDWDGDGKLDLLVGCAKRGSYPEPDTGLPWARRKTIASLQVVFFKNVGTNAQPKYEYPKQLQFRGTDTYHGAHENAPVACMLGEIKNGRPNLLIGMESGRLFFYAHDDITFIDAPKQPTAVNAPNANTKGQDE